MNVQPEYKENKTKKENVTLSSKRTTKKEEEKKPNYGGWVWADVLIEAPLFILKGLWYVIELIGHIIWIVLRGIGHALHHIFDIFN